MSRLPAYPAYKDSGVSWLGQVPQHWDVVSLKYLSEIVTGTTPPKSDEDNYYEGEFLFVKPEQLQDTIPIIYSDERLTAKGVNLARSIPAGSALVCCIGTIGKVGLAGRELSTNQQINSIIFSMPHVWLPRFGVYALLASSGEHQRLANKVVIAILNRAGQSAIKFPVPPLPEQRAIAAWLDEQTQRLDALTDKLKRLLEKLAEQRAALITRAVTRGLNPHVPLKDSGVPWLGQIPAHWEVKRLKHIAVAQYTKNSEKPEEMQYIGLENIESGSGNLILEIQPESVESSVSIFQPGDILFGKLRPYLAKVARASFSGCCTTEIQVLTPKIFMNGNFLFYFLLSQPFIQVINSMTYGTKMPRTNWFQMGHFFIPIPPIDEQTQIGEWIEEKTSQLIEIKREIETALERLNEYRSALITAAVTGQIDVRNHAGPD